MCKSVFVFFLFFCLFGSLNAEPSNDFVVLRCRDNSGMFSIFQDVLALVKLFDNGTYAGIKVSFENKGLYYDPQKGPNWWNYYCELIYFGNEKTLIKKEIYGNGWEETIVKRISRKHAFDLIQKYFNIREHILNKIETFRNENFNNFFIIGVHYRGTDKIIEAPRVSYEKMLNEINKAILKIGETTEYKIFLATDEKKFLDYLLKVFPDKVCYVKDALRSDDSKPIHLNRRTEMYKCGEDALIDCILLSKCNFLIRTSSNLSLWSTYFNPRLPVVMVEN